MIEISNEQMSNVQNESHSVPSASHGSDFPVGFPGCHEMRQKGISSASMENTVLNIPVLFCLNLNHNISINAIYSNLFSFKHMHKSKIKSSHVRLF